MPENRKLTTLEEGMFGHLFVVSSGMVGVCLTVIGLVQITVSVRKVATFADDLLALDAMLFLIAALATYWAMRTSNVRRLHAVERIADVIFLFAMALMAGICVFLVFEVSG